VIDPSTGKPSESDVKCAIVKSRSGVMSAAISYALTVLSSKRALETWKNSPYSFDAILVIDDGTVCALGAFAADGALDFTSGDYHLIRIKDK
jgi:thiamine biosynthesis lipoprotein ApbE